MDIVKPIRVRPQSAGVYDWADCGAGTSNALYLSRFIPYAKGIIVPRFGETRNVDQFSPTRDQDPVTYIIGDSHEALVERGTLEERFKTSGSKKQFEEDRRAGNIVLKPMLNCKIFGAATPKIVNWTSTQNVHINYPYSKMGGTVGGRCHPGTIAYPAIQVDGPREVFVERVRYRNVTAVPVSQNELQRMMRLVKGKLDSIQPNQGLVTQVVSEANSATWDIATELGEAPETIGYILGRLQNGISLCIRAKRDMQRSLSQGLTDTASLWMEYRYALMPIIYSVNDALDVLGMDAIQFQSFRGRKDTPLYLEGDDVGGYTVQLAPSYNDRVFLKYKYDVDSSIHHGLKINLAATAWELLPLSFVFDWFFQVGDYLTAAFQPSVVSQHGCQQSVRCKGPLILEGNASEVLKLDIDYYRCRIINPNAFIGINSDVFISFKRAMDALALSWLIFGKKNRRG